MSVGWDPKISGVFRLNDILGEAKTGEAQQAGAAAPTPQAMERPKKMPEPQAAATHPSLHKGTQGPLPFEREVSGIQRKLTQGPKERYEGAAEALLLARSYGLRRQLKARKQAVALCDQVETSVPTFRTAAKKLSRLLHAEGQLHELSPGQTTAALTGLAVLLDEERPGDTTDLRDIAALSRALMAHALVQLTVHFPRELAALGLTTQAALEQAWNLAEEAIGIMPELPDGHSAIGRVLLCSDESEAVDDALAVLEHALSLDADHDPALDGLGAALLALGRPDEALEHIDKLVRRGNNLPHALDLRALVLAALGRYEEARRDLDRALKFAPEAGLLYLDAARLAAVTGDEVAAQAHDARARELLEEAYDDIAAGLA